MLNVPTAFRAIDQFSGPVNKMNRTQTKFNQNLEARFARSERAVRRFGQRTQNLTRGMFNLRNVLVTGAVAVAGRQLIGLASNAAKAGDEIAKTAQKVGVHTDTLQQANFWADQNGISSDNLEKAMGRLNQRVGMAAMGKQKYIDALNEMGVSIRDNNGDMRETEDIMKDALTNLSQMESSQQQAAVGAELFGVKLSRELMPALQEGSLSFEDAAKRADELGIVIGEDALAASTKFADKQGELSAQFDALRTRIGLKLIPVMQEAIGTIQDWFMQNQDLIQQKIQVFIDNLGKAVRFLTNNMDNIILAVKIAVGVFGALKLITIGTMIVTKGMALALGIMKGVMAVVTAAQWAWNVAMSANPIGLIIVGVAALIGLIVVIINKWDSWGAAVAAFLGPLGMVISLIMEFRKRWDDIVSAFKDGGIMAGIKAIGKTIVSALIAPIQQLLKGIGKIPGLGFAADAAESLGNFRDNLFDDEAPEGEGQSARINNRADTNANFVERMQTNNARVDLNVNDPGGALGGVTTDNDDVIKINNQPTFAM